MSTASLSAPGAPTMLRDRAADRRLVRVWLYAMAAMVVLILVVGGITRLTESGLSIVEWEPIHGVVPPLTAAEWQDEFQKYQEIPEFKVLRPDMTLSEFKGIFWWEWTHRVLARLVGVVFALPFLFFLVTGRLERRLWPQLLTIFVLGGLQGAVGWWMVYSGVFEGTEATDVSHYRLAIHLVMASLIFTYLMWVARGLRPPRPLATYATSGVKAFGAVLIVLVLIQLYLGALVAGLNAGLAASDWPLMNGELIPSNLLNLDPVWLNFFDNHITVQFTHRMVAYLIAILIVAHAIYLARNAPGSRLAFSSYRLVALVFLQVILGIATVMSLVPIGLALVHQFVAILLLAGTVIHRRGMSPPIPITS